jgi:hypothetical protein
MNFVSIWKVCSIALTGAFGILGLLTEFKDKQTKKVTKWGLISLIGILVTTICGTAAQLKESYDTNKAQAADLRRAVSILQNTSRTVNSIDRMMASLVDASVDVTYDIDCKSRHITPFVLNNSEEPKLATESLILLMFVDPSRAQRFIDGAFEDNLPDLALRIEQKRSPDEGANDIVDKSDDLWLVIEGYSSAVVPGFKKGDGILSLTDLPRTTLIVRGDNSRLDDIPVIRVRINIRDGRSIEADSFHKVTVRGEGAPRTAYRYVFPSVAQPSIQ